MRHSINNTDQINGLLLKKSSRSSKLNALNLLVCLMTISYCKCSLHLSLFQSGFIGHVQVSIGSVVQLKMIR